LENEQKGQRVSRTAIIALGVISLVIALFLIRILINLFSTDSNNQSPNWAGYVAASYFTNQKPIFTEVNGSWTVPTVTVS